MNSWANAAIVSFISSSKDISFKFAHVWIRKGPENSDCSRYQTAVKLEIAN